MKICACCLHVKSSFLPSFISTPSVRPRSLSQRDTKSVATHCEAEADEKPNQSHCLRCEYVGTFAFELAPTPWKLMITHPLLFLLCGGYGFQHHLKRLNAPRDRPIYFEVYV